MVEDVIPRMVVFNNLQRLSIFYFVAALKAGPVHSTIHSVEFWAEWAAENVRDNTGINKT